MDLTSVSCNGFNRNNKSSSSNASQQQHFTSLIDDVKSPSSMSKQQIFKQIQETMDILKQDLLNKSRSSDCSSSENVTNANANVKQWDEVERLRFEQERIQKERDMIEQEKERLRVEAERLRLEREAILSHCNNNSPSNPAQVTLKYPATASTSEAFMDTTYLVVADSGNGQHTEMACGSSSFKTTPQKTILKKPVSPPPVPPMPHQQQQQRLSNLNQGQMLYSMDQNLRFSVPNLILDQQSGQQLPVAAQTTSPYKTSSGGSNKQYQTSGGCPTATTARIYQTSNSRSHKLIGNFFLD
jgi:hypothetical protein